VKQADSKGKWQTAEELDSQGIESSDGREGPLDIVVMGGSFSGASTAILLKRWLPWARILIVESSQEFDSKVGEATVELSALFLTRALDCWDHLCREHMPKHGLRFWTTDGQQRSLAEMTELGPSALPDIPSFQLDRAKFDEMLLQRAVDAGCELLRPARVIDVVTATSLGQETKLALEVDGTERLVRARWVVDATGRHGLLSKKLGLREKLASHPTTAYWARWDGVKDLDSSEMVDVNGVDPTRLPPVACSRRLGTNHFLGEGWWTWVIPLSGGQTSIGLVHNEKLVDLPGSGSLRPRFEEYVRRVDGLRDLLKDAELDADDFRTYRHLPYCASQYMGPGWALVGDAAAFLDPFYSPGLDHCAYSVYATARIIQEALSHDSTEGELAETIERHNTAFKLSYERQYEALYRNKYEIFGDPELLAAAYDIDTAMYFLGVLRPAFDDLEELRFPPLGRPIWQATLAFRTLRFFHRRLVFHARLRKKHGIYGRRAVGSRLLSFKFELGAFKLRAILRGLRRWIGVEFSGLPLYLRGVKKPKVESSSVDTRPVQG
jgi:flavin-dependent dehydrogenase